MALWQYSFWAIPRNSILEKYGIIPKAITEDAFNDTEWFKDINIDIFIDSIKYLNKNEHWNLHTTFFGNYESNCIQISYDNNIIKEIFLRIDLRDDYNDFVNSISTSLLSCGLILLDEELNSIQPTPENIISAITTYKFHGLQWSDKK